ncbi:MAG: hypothetical protein ACYDA8_17045 [Deferrisomatales bacterium]
MQRWIGWAMGAVLLAVVTVAGPAAAQVDPKAYPLATQGELIQGAEANAGKKVRIEGIFVFAGSDFCYQIRKTKINTRDFFCFALGPTSLLRLYLRKDHPQADLLLNLKKGDKVTAYGVFDTQGADFSYLVADEISVERAP